MHRLILLVILIAWGVSGKPQQNGLSKAEVEEMLDSFILDCATKEGATADEIGFIRNYGTPQSRPQKCAVACVGEMFGITKNGIVLIDNIMNLATRILSAQPDKIEVVRKIAEACSDGHDSDRCEASTNTYTCAIAEAKKLGFNLKDFI